MENSSRADNSYLKRFTIACVASFIGLLIITFAQNFHVLTAPDLPGRALAAATLILVASVPSSLLSALAFRRSQLALILGAQVLTAVAMAAVQYGLMA